MLCRHFPVRLGAATLTATIIFIGIYPAQGATRVWQDHSGSFNDLNNWHPNAVPGVNDSARFSEPNATYTVDFPNSYTNIDCYVMDGNVTFASSVPVTYTYTLAGGSAHVLNGSLTLGTSLHPLNLTASSSIILQDGGYLYVDYGSTASAASLSVGLANSIGSVTVLYYGRLRATDPSRTNYLGSSGGAGHLTITNNCQGDIQGKLFLGNDAGSLGDLVIYQGGTLNINNSLYVGGSDVAAGGTGRLTVQGRLDVASTLKFWHDSEFYIEPGASITTHSFDNSEGNAFLFEGGSLTVSGGDFKWGPSSQTTLKLDGNGGIPSLTLDSAIPSISYSEIRVGDSAQAYLSISGTTPLNATTERVGKESSGIGTFDQSGGTNTATTENVGEYGTGTFNHSAGINNTTWLNVGEWGGSRGYYNLSGTGQVTATWESIGNLGFGTAMGTFMQTGGVNTVTNYLSLGSLDADAVGYYNLSGTGEIDALRMFVGDRGTGTMDHTAGINNSSFLSLGFWEGSHGYYNLSETGQINANSEIVGELGAGVFTQTGGDNNIDQYLYIAEDTLSSGTYDLSGGTLHLTAGPLCIGGYDTSGGGTGVLSVSESGQLTIDSGKLKIWNTGTLNQSGGSITTHSFDNSEGGTINFSGGTLTVSGGTFAWGPPGQTALTIDGSGTPSLTLDSATPSISYGEVRIGDTAHGQLTISGTTPFNASTEYIGYDPAGHGTFTQLGGTNDVGIQYVGYNGTGTVDQSNGTNSIWLLYLGQNPLSHGTYNLSGTGEIEVGHFEIIGMSGTGSFSQTGGLNTVQHGLFLGFSPGSHGTYDLSAGTLDLTSSLFIGGSSTDPGGTGVLNVSDTGQVNVADTLKLYPTGTLNQSGGSITTRNFDNSAGGTINFTGGTLTVNGGTFAWGPPDQLLLVIDGSDAPSLVLNSATPSISDYTVRVGWNNQGQLTISGTTAFSAGSEVVEYGVINQSGGTNTISPNVALIVGGCVRGNATYNLSGGELTCLNFEAIGRGGVAGGVGIMNHSAGTNNAGSIYLGDSYSNSHGFYNLSDTGAVNATFECLGFPGEGTFTQTGGVNTVNNAVIIAQEPLSKGYYNISGGNLNLPTGSIYVGGYSASAGGTGNLAISGSGQINISNGTLKLWNTGTLNQSGGNVATCNFDNIAGGTINFSGGTLTVGGTSGGSFAWGPNAPQYYADLIINGSGAPSLILQNATPNNWYSNVSVGSDAAGAMTISGNTQLHSWNLIIGDAGTGTFSNFGGFNEIQNVLVLGSQSTGNGTYYLNGLLRAMYETIGGMGTGIVNHTGGPNTNVYVLDIAQSTGSHGTYSLSGTGQLSAEFENVGVGGVGTFNQSGGTNTVISNSLTINSQSSYNLTGGTLITPGITGALGAAFNIGGGTLQASANMELALPINITGIGGKSNIDTAGHWIVVENGVSGLGGLNKLGAGELQFQTPIDYRGDTMVNGGTLTISNGITASGTSLIDVQSGKVFLWMTDINKPDLNIFTADSAILEVSDHAHEVGDIYGNGITRVNDGTTYRFVDNTGHIDHWQRGHGYHPGISRRASGQ